VSVSLVFCCYQQVYGIFNMSCLGMILQVTGRDGMSTPQNGAAAYSQSHISRICQGGFLLPSLRFSSFIQQYALQKIAQRRDKVTNVTTASRQ